MGKASSSKKVARAARAGGAAGPKRRKLGFPAAIVAIVVLGVGLVVFARGDFTAAAATSPTPEEHWHNAYGVYVCTVFNPPMSDAASDTTGIHTHEDGVIHIHPFTAGSAGRNATLAKWGEVVGMQFGSDYIIEPDGDVLKSGFDCSGNTDTTLGVWVWPADDLEAEPRVYTKDFGDIRFEHDRDAVTIAVVPSGTTPPRPESVPTLDNLTDVEGATPTTAAGSPTPVDPAASVDPTATTVPGATTDSSVAGGSTAVDPNASTPATTAAP